MSTISLNQSMSFVEYEVVYPTGAKCRKKKSITSQHLGNLSIGTIVRVEEIDGRRCRISSPINGWMSLRTANGQSILQIHNSEGMATADKYSYYGENGENGKKKKISKFKKIFNKNSNKKRKKK
eukprot:223496_1